jgi:hypothetical protein
LLLLLAIAGCTRPVGYDNGYYNQRSGGTDYRVEERPDGFAMTVRIEQYQFIPDAAALEERCRRDATALALEEADKRGLRAANVDTRRVRSSAGRDIVTGTTSCTAMVPVTAGT